MYMEFYGLSQEPFKLTPDPQFFFLGEHQNKALAHLLYGINNCKGFIALTGEVGAGKTTLCRLLLRQLEENISVAIILNSLVDSITLLKQINRDFAIPYNTDSHDDLVGYLYDYLITEKKKNRNVLVIVDECQNLKFDVLEQLRMLSNLETEKDKLLQILLIGQPEFITMLESHELRQLNQRITVRAHISALSLREMEMYLMHRLKVAGNENAVRFTRGALRKIYNYSGGIPRKINVISDYALLAGYVENSRKITSSLVKKALDDIEVKREIDRSGILTNLKFKNFAMFLLLAASFMFAIYLLKNPVIKDISNVSSKELNISLQSLNDVSNIHVEKEKVIKPVKIVPKPEIKEEVKSLVSPVPVASKISMKYFNTLDVRQKGLWLLLSTWGVEVNHPRRDENGRDILLENQLERFNFTILSTWAPIEMIKNINLPCAVEILKNNERQYWVLNLVKGTKLHFYTAPETVETFDESDFLKIWQGNSFIIVEKGENTLEGDGAIFRGMQNEQVMKLKQILSKLSIYQGTIDENYDLSLENAVKSFQKNNALTDDGIIGVEAKLIFYSLLSRNIPRILDRAQAGHK